MHGLPRGIEKLLKECFAVMRWDFERTTNVIKKKSSSYRPFQSIKYAVHRCLKRLISNVFYASPGLQLDLGFIHISSVSQNNELFCDPGLMGMLEARNMYRIDRVSPFLEANVDAYYGTQNADVTRIYTSYVEMMEYFIVDWSLLAGAKRTLKNCKQELESLALKEESCFRNTNPLLWAAQNSMHYIILLKRWEG